MNVRRMGVMAAGLVTATSLVLAGAGAASAATPALKIKAGAVWTVKENGGGCEQDVFASNGSFSSADAHGAGDAGTWSGGKSTIKMTWTTGGDAGLIFSGTFVSSRGYYKGTIVGPTFTVKTKLVHSAVSGC